MESFGRLQGELHGVQERITQFRREAEMQQQIRAGRKGRGWRTQLASRLHDLADRLEPAPYSTKGELI